VNGEPRTSGDAHVSARDRGFTLADGLFETMRIRQGRAFRLDHHLARLGRGLLALHILSPAGMREWVLGAIETAGPGEEASLRLTVTRGIGAGGLAPVAAQPTVVITISPMPVFPDRIYESGLAAHVASGRRNERAMTTGLKTLAYVDSVAGFLEAQRAGADEALFLDTDGHCSEATASNLFVWTGSLLLTPPMSCGALPGITRASVLELASGLGLDTSDRPVTLEQTVEAEEAFLSSSLRGVAPLVRIGGRAIGAGSPGPVTRRLAAAYAALVARECGS
jgi:branched-chain amino acid aminotransferase